MPARKKRDVKPVDLDAIVGNVASEVADAVGKDDVAELEQESLSWARDVYAVRDLIGEGRPTKAKAGSAFRYALWKRAEADLDRFVDYTLPKAMVIYDRHMAKNVDDTTMEKHEEKAVAELERILKGAIEEALEE